MNSKPLGKILAALLIGIAFLGCTLGAQAAAPKPAPVALGDNTYSLTRSSNFYFKRSTEKLGQEAREDAEAYCAAQGKKMKEVSLKEQKGSLIYGGFSHATLVFKALAADDPELTSDGPTAHGDSSDLAKLVDLKKEGVLSDAEFDAAKKRLMERSGDMGKLEDLHKKGILSDEDFVAAKKRLVDRMK